MNEFIRSLVLMLAFAATALVAEPTPLENGMLLFQKGDYSNAGSIFLTLAEQGNPKAQFNLGMMFDLGLGTKEDHIAAAYWYHKAALQGLVNAQVNLGVMYGFGRGVQQNYEKS